MPFTEEVFNLTPEEKTELLQVEDPNDALWSDEGLHRILFEKFKIKEFKAGQLEAIRAILQGKDIFVRMATGSGKSLIWQVRLLLSCEITS